MHDKSPQQRVRISSYGQGRNGYTVTLDGMTPQEGEQLQGVLFGQWWMSTDRTGRLEFVDGRKPLPAPYEDTEMLPFWGKYAPPLLPSEMRVQRLDQSVEWPPFSPHISIQHLCPYKYSLECYKAEAKKLEAWGFECLRSRRGASGRFWEIWYLPFLGAATGHLRESMKDDKDIDGAVSFLCANASFGTLDVSVQQAAMGAPD